MAHLMSPRNVILCCNCDGLYELEGEGLIRKMMPCPGCAGDKVVRLSDTVLYFDATPLETEKKPAEEANHDESNR
jgi:hypothetical protein